MTPLWWCSGGGGGARPVWAPPPPPAALPHQHPLLVSASCPGTSPPAAASSSSPLPSPPPGAPHHLAGALPPQHLGLPPLCGAGHLGWLRPRVDQTAVVLLRLSTMIQAIVASVLELETKFHTNIRNQGEGPYLNVKVLVGAFNHARTLQP